MTIAVRPFLLVGEVRRGRARGKIEDFASFVPQEFSPLPNVKRMCRFFLLLRNTFQLCQTVTIGCPELGLHSLRRQLVVIMQKISTRACVKERTFCTYAVRRQFPTHFKVFCKVCLKCCLRQVKNALISY